MDKRKQRIVITVAAVVLVVLIAVFWTVWRAARPNAAAGSKTITVEVTHKDGSTRSFTYRTDAAFLGEVLLANGLVEGEEGTYGLFILSADGEEAVYEEDGGWWAVYRGEEMALEGVSSIPIRDGDAFALVYTIG